MWRKHICRAESGFLYDRKYAHKCWKKRELDSTEFGLVCLGFSFAKNRDWRGNGLEGKEFVRKTTIRLSYEWTIGCKQELAARKNTARLPVNPALFIQQKGTYIIYGQNIKKEKKDSFNKQYVTFIQKEADHKGIMLVGSKD